MVLNYVVMSSKKKKYDRFVLILWWFFEIYWFLIWCMFCIIIKKNIKNDFLNNENKKDLEYL